MTLLAAILFDKILIPVIMLKVQLQVWKTLYITLIYIQCAAYNEVVTLVTFSDISDTAALLLRMKSIKALGSSAPF